MLVMWCVTIMLPFMQINKSSYTPLSHLLSVEWNKDYVWINISITSIKERLVAFININPLKNASRLQKVDMITEFGNKNQKKEKKKKDHLWLHFYYKFVLWLLGILGRSCHSRGLTPALEFFLWRYGESGQHNLHALGSLFLLWGVLGGHGRKGTITGHFFGRVGYLFHVLRWLYFFGGDVGYRKSFSWAFLAFICPRGDRGAWGA